MSAVDSGKVTARLRYIRKQVEVTSARWLKYWGGRIAVFENRQFHKGQPGWWTGTFARSMGVSQVLKLGNKQMVSIGPGQAERGAFTMVGETWQIQALSLEFGNMRPHFLGYKDHPMFELWARQHGFKTTNSKGQVSGGLVVGKRPDSILRRGIHYKEKALNEFAANIDQSRKMLAAELERLTKEARAVVA